MPRMIASDPIAWAPFGGTFAEVAPEPAPYVRGLPPRQRDLEVWRGDTFLATFRWEQDLWDSVPIQSISRGASARITLAGDVQIPDGWRVAVVDALGLIELNAEIDAATMAPRDRSLRPARVLNPSTIELNGVSTALYRAHKAGTGYLLWRPPVPLSGYDARMAMRAHFGGPLLLPTLTTVNGGLTVDPVKQMVQARISSTITSGLNCQGLYDLEMVAPDGTVTKTHYGTVALRDEITTTEP